MKFAVFTHVPHKDNQDGFYSAYGPYVKEMNLWFKYVDEILMVAPLSSVPIDKIDIPYNKQIKLVTINEINFINYKNAIVSICLLPVIFFKIIKAMISADHIHLRCPGNIGLLGCIAQIFFPNKKKSAKYAGNWDKNSNQPLSYKLQKWILNSTLLTKNMKVMVYGNWNDSSKNVIPFFTASYTEKQKYAVSEKNIDKNNIRLIFVGTLLEGKQPDLAIKIALHLRKEGYNANLDIFGNGGMYKELHDLICTNDLQDYVVLHGNQSADEIIKYYSKANFLVFLSKSEGWPKVVAEAMWWGCLPITTAVSCVPEMLGNETRGSIISPNIDDAVNTIKMYLKNNEMYLEKVANAKAWARQFTLEKFDCEIGNLLN